MPLRVLACQGRARDWDVSQHSIGARFTLEFWILSLAPGGIDTQTRHVLRAFPICNASVRHCRLGRQDRSRTDIA